MSFLITYWVLMYSNFNICNGIYRTSVEDKKTWHQNYLKKSQIFQYLKVKKTTNFLFVLKCKREGKWFSKASTKPNFWGSSLLKPQNKLFLKNGVSACVRVKTVVWPSVGIPSFLYGDIISSDSCKSQNMLFNLANPTQPTLSRQIFA